MICVLASIVSPLPVTAQDVAPEEESRDPSAPEPYDPAEFPSWSRDLRRAEIIALGSFPITMILSGFTYQLGRFAYQSYRAGEPNSDFAPWFFSTSTGERYNNDERIGLIVSAATLSVGVALLDYALGRRERAQNGNE